MLWRLAFLRELRVFGRRGDSSSNGCDIADIWQPTWASRGELFLLWNGILTLFKWVKPLVLFIRRCSGFVEGAGEVLFIRDMAGQGCFEGVVSEDSRRLRVSEGFCEGSAFLLRGDTKMPPPAFGWPVLVDWDGWIDMLRYLSGFDFPPFFLLLSSLLFLSCIFFSVSGSPFPLHASIPLQVVLLLVWFCVISPVDN